MNTFNNATTNSSAKKQAQQLLIELKNITPHQRQSLLNIYQALDRIESANKQPIQSNLHRYDDEFNQEDQYLISEEYPHEWVQRVNRRRSK